MKLQISFSGADNYPPPSSQRLWNITAENFLQNLDIPPFLRWMNETVQTKILETAHDSTILKRRMSRSANYTECKGTDPLPLLLPTICPFLFISPSHHMCARVRTAIAE